MQASFTRTLALCGLLAVSLTGCQTPSLGKFSWKPKWPSFGRNKDTAVASNAGTGAGSTADPWLPSQQATPGYGAPVASNTGYGVGGQYNTGYAGMPTSYTGAENPQGAWNAGTGTGTPTAPNTQYDAASYAAMQNPAAAPPQVSSYDYSQPPAMSTYPQQTPGYAPQTAAAPPAQQPMNSWDPAAQYGPAPSAYAQPYGAQAAPTAQMADNTRYPSATQYDGTQQYGAQPYGAAPTAAPSGYSAAPPQEAWPPAEQGGYSPAAQPASYQPQPYRPGGTSDYTAPAPQTSTAPSGYDPTYGGSAYPQ